MTDQQRAREALEWHLQSVGDPNQLSDTDRKHFKYIKTLLTKAAEGKP